MKRGFALVLLFIAPAAFAQRLASGDVVSNKPLRARAIAALSANIPPDGTSTHTDPTGDLNQNFAFTPFDQSTTITGNTVRTVVPTSIFGTVGAGQWGVTAFRNATEDEFDVVQGTWDGASSVQATSPENPDNSGAADILAVSFGPEDATHFFVEFQLRSAPSTAAPDTLVYYLEFFGANTYAAIETDVYPTITQVLVSNSSHPLPTADFEDVTGATVTTGDGLFTITIDTVDAIPDVPAEPLGQPYFVVGFDEGARYLRYEFDREEGQWEALLAEAVEGEFFSTVLPVTVTSSRSGNSLTLSVPLSELALPAPWLSFRVGATTRYGPDQEQFYMGMERMPTIGLLPHTCQGTCSSDVPETAVRNEPVTFSASYLAPEESPLACSTNLKYAWSFGDSTSATGPTVLHVYETATTETWRVVITGDAGEVCRMSGQITINPPPRTITSFAPAKGSPTGGTTVTIHGTNFAAGDDVFFGAVESKSVAVIDANTIVAVAPEQAPGEVTLKVQSFNGSNFATASSPFLYALDPVTDLAAISGGGITELTWTYGRYGAHSFDVFRKDAGAFVLVGSVNPGPSTRMVFHDTTATPWTAYIYKVKPVAFNTPGPDSNLDHTFTGDFTDRPLVSEFTPVRALHWNELRVAINSLRFAVGLSAVSWDPNLVGKTVKLVHLTEMRTALSEALAVLGKSFTPTNAATPGLPIRAVHLQEMRNALN